MPVHGSLAEVAAAGRRLHPAEEVVDAARDGLLVTPLEVGVSRTEKGEQRDRGARRGARERAGIAARPLAAAAVEIEAPRPVVGLMEREPGEALFDGRLARRAPPLPAHRPASRLASARGIGDAALPPGRRPIGRQRGTAGRRLADGELDRHGCGPWAVGRRRAVVDTGRIGGVGHRRRGVDRLEGRDVDGDPCAGDLLRRDLRFATGGRPVVVGADLDRLGVVRTVGLRPAVVEREHERPGGGLPVGRHRCQRQENAEEDMDHDTGIGRPRHRTGHDALDQGRRRRPIDAAVGRGGGLGIPRRLGRHVRALLVGAMVRSRGRGIPKESIDRRRERARSCRPGRTDRESWGSPESRGDCAGRDRHSGDAAAGIGTRLYSLNSSSTLCWP